MKRDEIEVRDKMAKEYAGNISQRGCTVYEYEVSAFQHGWDSCLSQSTLVRQMVEVLTDMLNENNSAPYVANLLIQRYREAIK